jgi:hypothetical protein
MFFDVVALERRYGERISPFRRAGKTTPGTLNCTLIGTDACRSAITLPLTVEMARRSDVRTWAGMNMAAEFEQKQ